MKKRNATNEIYINYYLGKIDMFDERQMQQFFEQYGNDTKSIETSLQKKLEEDMQRARDQKYPLNEFISYGVSGKTVHIHVLPKSIKEDIKQKGMRRFYDEATLYVIDALEKIEKLSQNHDWEQVYAISPILSGAVLRMFKELGFETQLYGPKDMTELSKPEAILGKHIFPEAVRVGTAKISLERLKSQENHEKVFILKQELYKKGINITKQEEGR